MSSHPSSYGSTKQSSHREAGDPTLKEEPPIESRGSDAVSMESLAHPDEGDVVPIAALAPEAPPSEPAETVLPGWEQWEEALASAGSGTVEPSRAGLGETGISGPLRFPTDDFGFLELPTGYSLAAARGVADPAEWPTDEEWRRPGGATPMAGTPIISGTELGAAEVDARIRVARMLVELAARVGEGRLRLPIIPSDASEGAVMAAVLSAMLSQDAGS